MQRIAMTAAFCLVPVTLCAQWLNFKQPGIPRSPDGKPDLTAPTPRAPDGKPDLSGLWGGGPNSIVPGGPNVSADVIQDIKDEAIFTPAAQALFQKRHENLGTDWPPLHCLPIGPVGALVGTYRIVQSPTVVALLFNSATGDDYRQVFLDGRELPRDPNPTWRGYSVGRWEGDTLVIETAGFNDRSWLDEAGHSHSERMHMMERLRRIDFGHLQYQVTFDDPETMTRPLTLQRIRNYSADTDMLESICENEREARHLVGKAIQGVKLSAAVLAKYAGAYENRPAPGADNGPLTIITLLKGQLYWGSLPLIPQSETSFQWFDGRAFDFSQDATGSVISLTRDLGQGHFAFYVKR